MENSSMIFSKIKLITYICLAALLFTTQGCQLQTLQPKNNGGSIDDKVAIAELITQWTYHRDQENWQALENTFIPDGRISISWHDGTHEAFVTASKKIAARGGSLLKHQIGLPVTEINGNKAISEVNVIIMVRAKTPFGEFDTSSYARFYDRLIKQNGQWKFAERIGVYEKDRIDPVNQPALPAPLYEGLEAFPEPIKFLAKSLTSAGLKISETTILDKSPEWEILRISQLKWLQTK
jgi:hypothetical protein